MNENRESDFGPALFTFSGLDGSSVMITSAME